MKKILHWLDENLEEFILVIFLIAMTLIMGIQIFCRYVLGMSLSWSEELTRYLFIWCGFLSVSYCSKKCLSIKIEQFVAIFSTPRKSNLQSSESHLRADLFYLHDSVCLFLYDVFCSQRTAFTGMWHSDVLCTGRTSGFFCTGRIPCPAALDH